MGSLPPDTPNPSPRPSPALDLGDLSVDSPRSLGYGVTLGAQLLHARRGSRHLRGELGVILSWKKGERGTRHSKCVELLHAAAAAAATVTLS